MAAADGAITSSWLTQVEGLSLYEAIDIIDNWDGRVVERSADARRRGRCPAHCLRDAMVGRRIADRRHAGGALSHRDPRHRSRRSARQYQRARASLPSEIACSAPASTTLPARTDARSDHGRRCGIQRTALTPDAQKIDRKMLGPAGVVQLWPAGKRLVIGEGLETTLAAATRLTIAANRCAQPGRRSRTARWNASPSSTASSG